MENLRSIDSSDRRSPPDGKRWNRRFAHRWPAGTEESAEDPAVPFAAEGAEDAAAVVAGASIEWALVGHLADGQEQSLQDLRS
jgi:hypothetical protein